MMYGLTSNDRAWTVEAMGHPTVLSGPGTANQSYAIASKVQQPATSFGKITFRGQCYLVRWDRRDARRPMFPTIPPSPPHPTSMGLFLTH